MQLTEWHAFAFGVVGSMAVEFVLFMNSFGIRGGYPGKYKSWVFWLVRTILGALSGAISMAYFTPQVSAIVYVHVGAATPTLILRASRFGDESAKSDAESAET